jgi:glycosyltransferase involved in cell wall biosynthesis
VDTVHAVTSSLSLVLLRGQLRYLREAGFHPGVVSGPGRFVEQIEVEESVDVFTVPMERDVAPVKDLGSFFRIWRLLRRLRPAICNAGTPKAGLLVTLAARLAGVPVRIYTMRGLRLETASGLKRRILYVAERIACACADRVVCVSPSLRDRAVSLKLVRENKAIVLASGSSNGIDVGRFAATPARLDRAADIRRELNIDGGPVIGYIGRFTRDKGIPELVTAFDVVRQRFGSASLLLIGSAERGDTLNARIRARIDAGGGIVAIPFQPHIAPYYLAMDLFVLPTHREGFPNTVLEAQAAGRPVVTTTATGAVDSIVDGETGVLVPVGDSQALADAISQILANSELARRLGGAGRERVEREFRQEVVWGELVKLYRALLEERGVAVPLSVDEEKLCLQK